MFGMMKMTAVIALVSAAAAPAFAQSADTPAPPANTSAATAATPAVTADTPAAPAENQWLQIHFRSGSATIAKDQVDMLDQAARTFREGDPFVMIVAGGADTVGSPDNNLALSLARATAVADALQARGIPVDRLQVLGRGNSELKVQTPNGVDESQNRVVEISWR